MMRLKSKLLSLNVDKREKTKVFSPKNCEELKIPFKADKTAKVVGKLAQLPPPSSTSTTEDSAQLITGVLVQNDFKMSLMAPEDLREYAGLTTTTITCKQRLSLSAAGIELVKWALEGMFGSVEVMYEELRQNGETKANGGGANGIEISSDQEIAHGEVDRPSTILLIMGCVFVRCYKNGDVELEWEGNMLNDGIADAVMAVLFTVESSPAAVKRKKFNITSLCNSLTCPPDSSSKNPHAHDSDLSKRNPHTSVSITERLERVLMFLESQFGHSITPIERPKIQKQEPKSATADLDTVMASQSAGEDEDVADLEAQELVRLHRLGIPVPGVEIRVDKHVAKVWLETLEVESSYTLLRDRVRVVIERAVETVAPLWTQRKGVTG
jgi:cleavage and polyadenylation specificity factor subunit 3